MSPARTRRAYRPPRRRREVVLASVGVLTVVLVTVGLLWLLAPHDDTSTPTTITVPTRPTTSTSAPGGTTTTLPTGTTPTSSAR